MINIVTYKDLIMVDGITKAIDNASYKGIKSLLNGKRVQSFSYDHINHAIQKYDKDTNKVLELFFNNKDLKRYFGKEGIGLAITKNSDSFDFFLKNIPKSFTNEHIISIIKQESNGMLDSILKNTKTKELFDERHVSTTIKINNNKILNTILDHKISRNHIRPIHISDIIQNNQPEMLRLILKNEKLKDVFNSDHITQAITSNSAEILKDLVSKNSYKTRDLIEEDHVDLAIRNNNTEAIKIILEKNPKVVKKQHLMTAIESGENKILTEILDKKPDLLKKHHVDSAIKHNNSEAIKIILEENPKIVNEQHLMTAIESGKSEIITEILKKQPKLSKEKHAFAAAEGTNIEIRKKIFTHFTEDKNENKNKLLFKLAKQHSKTNADNANNNLFESMSYLITIGANPKEKLGLPLMKKSTQSILNNLPEKYKRNEGYKEYNEKIQSHFLNSFDNTSYEADILDSQQHQTNNSATTTQSITKKTGDLDSRNIDGRISENKLENKIKPKRKAPPIPSTTVKEETEHSIKVKVANSTNEMPLPPQELLDDNLTNADELPSPPQELLDDNLTNADELPSPPQELLDDNLTNADELPSPPQELLDDNLTNADELPSPPQELLDDNLTNADELPSPPQELLDDNLTNADELPSPPQELLDDNLTNADELPRPSKEPLDVVTVQSPDFLEGIRKFDKRSLNNAEKEEKKPQDPRGNLMAQIRNGKKLNPVHRDDSIPRTNSEASLAGIFARAIDNNSFKIEGINKEVDTNNNEQIYQELKNKVPAIDELKSQNNKQIEQLIEEAFKLQDQILKYGPEWEYEEDITALKELTDKLNNFSKTLSKDSDANNLVNAFNENVKDSKDVINQNGTEELYSTNLDELSQPSPALSSNDTNHTKNDIKTQSNSSLNEINGGTKVNSVHKDNNISKTNINNGLAGVFAKVINDRRSKIEGSNEEVDTNNNEQIYQELKNKVPAIDELKSQNNKQIEQLIEEAFKLQDQIQEWKEEKDIEALEKLTSKLNNFSRTLQDGDSTSFTNTPNENIKDLINSANLQGQILKNAPELLEEKDTLSQDSGFSSLTNTPNESIENLMDTTNLQEIVEKLKKLPEISNQESDLSSLTNSHNDSNKPTLAESHSEQVKISKDIVPGR